MTLRRDPVHTTRLVLRPWQPADAPALRRLLVDEEVRAFLGGPVAVGDVDARLDTELAPTRTGSWAVTSAIDGKVVGWMSVEVHDAEAEVSWQLLPEHVGQGLAREAVVAVLGVVWADTDVDRVVAVTQEANARSRRLAEALGMRHESSFEQWGAPQVRFVLDRPEVTA
jgi:RimJ/RimL family protein N-acetyltransferase